ncbi:MAG: radical SAM protein [Thermodesulfobacteriota bacterium]
MNILLINPIMDEDQSAACFPLGLAYVAASLLGEGHSVQVLDFNADDTITDETILDCIKERAIELIGLTAMISQYKSVKRLSGFIKAHMSELPVIIGGALVSTSPEYILRNTEVDIGVLGEGELTMPALACALAERGELGGVEGICFMDGGEFVATSPRVYRTELDSYPMPAWDRFPVDTYLDHGTFGMDDTIRSMDIISSRGCPYRCTYCCHGLFGYKFRARSPESILSEMVELNRRYGTTGFIFRDDLFVLDKERVLEFCELLIMGGHNFKWACNGRSNLADEKVLIRMRSAGCIMVGYGVESGSEEMLVTLNKKQSLQGVRDAIRKTWDAGIIPRAYFMMGLPGETAKAFGETVELCKEIGIFNDFLIFTPIPGTELFDRAVREGLIQGEGDIIENWSSWKEDVLVNMSKIPTGELLEKKLSAEKEIHEYILKNHRALILKKFFIYLRQFGIRLTLSRSLRWVQERRGG